MSFTYTSVAVDKVKSSNSTYPDAGVPIMDVLYL